MKMFDMTSRMMGVIQGDRVIGLDVRNVRHVRRAPTRALSVPRLQREDDSHERNRYDVCADQRPGSEQQPVEEPERVADEEREIGGQRQAARVARSNRSKGL